MGSMASALLAGNEASPSLAEAALRRALEKCGESRVNGVLLFLTAEFARHAQPALNAVARAACCTEVAGGMAAGVFTEDGWVLDRPAAAVLVFSGNFSLAHCSPDGAGSAAILSYFGGAFPGHWNAAGSWRFGGSFAGQPGQVEEVAWQHGRLVRQCSVQMCGARVDIGVSSGWRLLGGAFQVAGDGAYELRTVAGASALDHLRRHLPSQDASDARLPLASLCAVLADDPGWLGTDGAPERGFAVGRCEPVAIVAANADGSLTLARRIPPGKYLAWAMRTPQSSAADMRRSVAGLAAAAPGPAAAIVFSCIGRGPYHYGDEDRDIACLRERFPTLPLIGSYGTGQIAPAAAGATRLMHNTVVTALISHPSRSADVQPDS